MSKYFQFVLVVAYALLTTSVLFIVIEVFGRYHPPVRDSLVFSIMIGWLLLCLSSAYYLTDIWLLFREVRKPIRAEEQKLRRCLDILQKKTGDRSRYRLRVEEEMGFNAFAIGHHTIVISKGALQALPEGELTAVMAHELGHLTTKDCIASMAYISATYLPRKLSWIMQKALQFLIYILRIGIAQGLIGLAIVCVLLYYLHVFHYVIGAIAFVLLIAGLEFVFGYLWLLTCRFTEYRQDAFAHKLGFGNELRDVLVKLQDSAPQKVNYFYTLRSTHPIIYNRIRRLEKLARALPEFTRS